MPHPAEGYRVDGVRVPSVTTICGRFKDSKALMYWSYTQGQRAERGEINNLYDTRDESANIGSICHDLIEKFLRGEVDAPKK